MVQNKITQIINKDERLRFLFGGMLLDVLLLIALIIYVGIQLGI
ncbi:MAG: hypothetical protein WB588_00985 [Dehalococcoidia bacterium]|jgi:hypothetical protein